MTPGQRPGHRVHRIWIAVAIDTNGDEMPMQMEIPSSTGGRSAIGPMFTSEERIARDIFPEMARKIGEMNNEDIVIREFRHVQAVPHAQSA